MEASSSAEINAEPLASVVLYPVPVVALHTQNPALTQPQTPVGPSLVPLKPQQESQDHTEAEGPGEQTQALALILSALGNVGPIDADEGSQGNGQEAFSGASVLRLLGDMTKEAIQDEANAWDRMLPPNDVFHRGLTTHDVWRAKSANLIQSPALEVAQDTPQSPPAPSALGQLLERQLGNARRSLEENRAKNRRFEQ